MAAESATESRAGAESFGAALLDKYAQVLRRTGAATCDNFPIDDSELIVAEGIRATLRLASHAALMMMECDAAYPYLIKAESIQRQYGLPAVDCVYHYAPLHGDYRYRLWGNRGSAHVFEIEIWRGHQSQMKDWTFFGTMKRRIAPGENMEITLSRDRRNDDWLELPPGDCCVMIRQYYYDWDRETPAQLCIEREGATYPPPQLSLVETSKRMGQIGDWLQNVAQSTRHVVQQYLDADPARLAIMSLPFGFSRLKYLRGHYRCKPDEAVILEVIPPKARYWNFQLGNVQWEALDYHLRMTAINGFLAKLGADGAFRAVISHVDPGVANWLDTGGRAFGLISGRYLDAEDAPVPTLRTVPLTLLGDFLPPDTPRITSEERQKIIRSRMLSTVRRQCGD